jgi:AcrR family transcriptional regulator
LFREKGYAGTTMSAIADRAGVNISLIYKYFPRGKTDIVLSVGADIMNEITSALSIDHSESPRDILKEIIGQMIAAHRQHSTILKALEVEYLSRKDVYEEEELKALTGDSKTKLRFSRLLTALGYGKSENLHELAKRIFHLIDGLIHRHVLIIDVMEDEASLAEYLTDLVFAYMDIHGQRNRSP